MSLVHLARHGHVHNPDDVVYARLPGFGLSAMGRMQAAALASRLETRQLTRIVASPLQRAVETALPVGADHGLTVEIDPDLSEWAMLDEWAGLGWSDLPVRFPRQFEAFMSTPDRLSGPESLADLAARMTALHCNFMDGGATSTNDAVAALSLYHHNAA